MLCTSLLLCTPVPRRPGPLLCRLLEKGADVVNWYAAQAWHFVLVLD